jgi:hypothetical protein
MRIRRIIRAFLVFLISIFGLLLLTFVLINLPFSHHFITRKVNHIFSSAKFPIHISSVNSVLPWSVYAEGVMINSRAGDTIVYAGKLRAAIKPFALADKRVILTDISLNSAIVNFTRNSEKEQLNIAAAFSKGTQSETIPQEIKKPWEITIGKAEISDLKFSMSDSVAEIFILQDIRSVKVQIEKMSLTKRTITAKSLDIEDATGSITINPVPMTRNADSASSWNFGLGELSASNINFVFEDLVRKLKLDLLAGEIKIKAHDTDIQKKLIDFEQISISRTNLAIHMDNQLPASGKGKNETSDVFPWTIHGDVLQLQDVSFSMANYTDTSNINPLSGFNTLGLGMKVSDLQIDSSTVNAGLKLLKFDLGNGFSLKEMNGKINSHSGKTEIKLNARSENSSLKLEGSAEGNIFDILKKPAAAGKADLTISRTSISLTDVFYFKPDLKKIPVFSTLSTLPVSIQGDLKMDDSVINITSISFSQIPGFIFSLQGKVNDIFSIRKATSDLKFGIIGIDHTWLSDMLKVLQTGITLPDYKTLSIEGAVTDSLRSPGLKLKLNSDLGRIELQGSFDFYRDNFSVNSYFDNILLGKILNNKLFGYVSGSAELHGSGVKQKAINAKAVVLADSFIFKDYIYRQSRIECTIHPGKYDLQLDVKDTSLVLSMNASINTAGKELTGDADATFLADLYALHLYKDTIITEGKLHTNLKVRGRSIQSDAELAGIKLTTPDDSATIKSVTLSLNSDSLTSNLSLKSDFFESEVHAERSAQDLGQFLKSYLNHLIASVDPRKADSLKNVSDLPMLDARVNLSYHHALGIIFSDTSLCFRNISFFARTNAEENKISYQFKGSGIRYATTRIGNLSVTLADSAAIMGLDLRADTCFMGSLALNSIRLKSHFSNWQSMTGLSVIDKQDRLLYNFDIASSPDSTRILLRIPSRQLTLNGFIWKLDSPDFLAIDPSSWTFSPELKMHTGNSDIAILKNTDQGWQVYELKLTDVKLTSFFRSEIVPGKPEFTLSGFLKYGSNKSLGHNRTMDLKFSDVRWSDLRIDKITLKGFFNSDTTGKSDLEIVAGIDTSEVKIAGSSQNSNFRNINAGFKNIQVNLMQPFVIKYLSDLKGTVSGEFKLSTKDDVNNLTGNLLINDGNLRVNTLNSTFRLPEDRIKFAGEKMIFNNFKVLDSLNNELFVEGDVDLSKKNQISTDLRITSSNLRILNTREEKNSSFYGDIFIDTRLSIKGPVASPVLKGKITLAKGTDIYLIQKENFNLTESQNVLTFVSGQAGAVQKGLKGGSAKSIYNKASVESIVEIDPATRININLAKKMFSIDMMIKGGGELFYNMLVNSQINMTGKYEISEGSANLKMVGWPNKAFKLKKGGFIRWDGKLDNPDLSLEAINRVRSSYVNPVDNKERYVDFDVTLKISNRLSAMDILFTINTPDQYLMSIINTMSPDEQMRQAITILLFEYIDLPGISTSSSYVSEQVNQLVASQLNQLTKTTIQGVDISFGIDTYTQGTASGGQETKTSLSYEVKKKLLKDRAQLEVSGRISDNGNQQNSSNVSLNNFSFAYRLDSAGSKFLKVYNEHTYEDVFEGDVIKTGVGFTYRKSYPSISDIWRKKKKKNPNNQDK